MADMNDIFGSDSDSDSKNEHQEKVESENGHQEEDEQDENNEQQSDDSKEDNEEKESNNNDDDQEDDDEEEIVRKKKAPKAADVFGDELADLSPDEESGDGQRSEKSNEERADEEHQEEEREEEEEEQIINIEIPRVKTDLGKDVHFVKLPNFLSVEPSPFNPETYEDENPHGDAIDEEGKTRVRLKVENTIRWRYDKDELGNLVKQSNARIVKWSDGSLSLYLGNEIFDIYKAPTQGDHNHLFIRQGNVLHGQTVFRTRLTFRPHSIDSMTHRKMTLSLVEHGAKIKKVKILTEIDKNPENKRQELLKKEEEKLKAASRRQNQQRRMREKAHSKGLTADYLEDRDRYGSDDEDNAISLSAIKNKFKNRNDSKTSIYSSSDDESDREQRLNKAKNDDYEEDDYESDEDLERKKDKSDKKKKMKKVVLDDEDE